MKQRKASPPKANVIKRIILCNDIPRLITNVSGALHDIFQYTSLSNNHIDIVLSPTID